MSSYTHEIKREADARVVLTIHTPQDMVSETYTNAIKEVAKKAYIKGFRKGKVPHTIIEQKFGDSIRAEATDTLISNAMKEVLETVDMKPLPYSRPQLENNNEENTDLIIDPQKAYSFSISYDTEPKVTLGDISQCAVSKLEFKISDDDIASELQNIQERNAITSDKEGTISEGDIVTCTSFEIDENGQDIDESKRENTAITIGGHQGIYDIDTDLIGMKKDEEKIITKTYDETYKPETLLAGKTIKLSVHIISIRIKELPAIDDELAQDVDETYQTLEDLKKHIKTQLEDRATYIIEDITRQEIITYLINTSEVEVPGAAIDYQVYASWQQFVEQYGGDEDMIMKGLSQMGNTKESLMEQWRPDAKKQVREQLITSKLIENNNIEISDEAVTEKVREESEKTNQNYDDIMKYYTEHNILSQIKYDMKQKKAFNDSLQHTIVKEEKTVSFSELQALSDTMKQHEHAHEHEHKE